VHPWVIFNPPGQPTIAYRAGDYAAFRHALMRAMPGETELTVWRPGADGDLAVQMIEWWAYLSDILTFYNQRIATQAYLGIADLPESVNRLIRILGYRPRPGLGASGTLAALLNTTRPVALPQGMQVQSKPGPGQHPQIFELSTATTVQQPDAVAARPVPPSSPLLSAAGTTLWLAGKVSGIGTGDKLLLVNAGAVTGGTITGAAWAIVQSVQAAADPYGDPVTAVTFASPVQGLPTGAQASQFAVLRSTQSATPWSTRPSGWNTAVIAATHLDLASIARGLAPGSLALLEVTGTPTDAAVATTLVTVSAYAEAIWYANGNGLAPPGAPALPIPVPHTYIDFSPALDGDWDDNSGLVTLRFGWSRVGQPVPMLTTAAAAFTGATAALIATSGFPAGTNLPILLQDGAGNGASAFGTVSADASTMTLGSLAAMPPSGLGASLTVLFDLIGVSRGKTVTGEVLGSGNAAVASQDFTLQNAPITYVADPAGHSGDGFSSTVQVWVNNVAWAEVPSFYSQPANAAVFVTREDEQGSTHVTFGDGINGATLPTGTNNVVASYRYGSGAAVPAPGTLTNIMQPIPGLRSIQNPIAPTGGADPDLPSRVRVLAPRSVLTFGRAISLDDYQVIAASAAGVIQAAASFAIDPISQRPALTIWVSGDAGAVAAVQAALTGAADPNRPVSVLPATPIVTTISLTYLRDPRYLDATVASALHAALLDADTGLFGANVVGIGQAFYDSQICAACLAVAGVVAIENVSVQVGPRFRPLVRVVRRGLLPADLPAPCTGHRHDPGQGNYIAVPDDGAHLLLTGRLAT
jgi:hypothetical protein